MSVDSDIQCILSYPNLDYPNPPLSESPNNVHDICVSELYVIHFLCISLIRIFHVSEQKYFFLPKEVQIIEDTLYHQRHLYVCIGKI